MSVSLPNRAHKPQMTGAREVFRGEKYFLIIGSILTILIFAQYTFVGGEWGILPDMSYPYTYEGDGLYFDMLARWVHDGQNFTNSRMGYPLGSDMLNYPLSDNGSFLLLKLASFWDPSFRFTVNSYIIATFVAGFVAAYVAFRYFSINKYYSFAGAMIYTFIPYHFLRFQHLFLLPYFVAPISFYAAYRIFCMEEPERGWSVWRLLFLFLIFTCSSFNIYYAFFSVIVIGVAGIASYFRNHNLVGAKAAIIAIGLVCAGVGLNIIPSISHQIGQPPVGGVTVRDPNQSEIYGLKMTQMVLPRTSHIIPPLARLTERYSAIFPLVNENSTATLGLIGSIGFFSLGLCILVAIAGGIVDPRIRILSIVVYLLFLIGTIGGGGALFAIFINSSIRAWNRISVFIAFGSLAGFLLLAQMLVSRILDGNRKNVALIKSSAIPALGSAFLIIGLADVFSPVCSQCTTRKSEYSLDSAFIKKIEQSLPAGSPVYQMPFVPFTAQPPLFGMVPFSMAAPYAISDTLRWSYGGSYGTETVLDATRFYRLIDSRPLDAQLDALERLGFAGLYVDRRGYADRGEKLLASLKALLNREPDLMREDGAVVFFRLNPKEPPVPGVISYNEAIARTGFSSGTFEERLKEGIEFTKPDSAWPLLLVEGYSGISGHENWGRWTDANLAPKATISFTNALPNKFDLVIKARPFGPNINQDVSIRIGHTVRTIKMSGGDDEFRVPFDLNGETTKAIEFIPPHVKTPLELGINRDKRKIGIGLVKLSIHPAAQ